MVAGVVRGHRFVHLVLLPLVDSAKDHSVLLQQDRDTGGGSDEHVGTEGNARARVEVVVAVDGRGTASTAAERPRLDADAAGRTEGEGPAVGRVGGEALAVEDDVVERPVLALLLALVEDVQVAGAVGADAENPRKIHGELVTVRLHLHHDTSRRFDLASLFLVCVHRRHV